MVRRDGKAPRGARAGLARAGFARAWLLASLALASSCWQPAFDPELADSALIAANMTKAATITVEGMKADSITRGLFLPRRVPRPVDGLWLRGYGGEEDPFKSLNAYYLADGQASRWLDIKAPNLGSAPDRPLIAMSPETSPEAPLEAAGVSGKGGFWATGRLFEPGDQPKTVRLDPTIGDSIDEALLLGSGFRAVEAGRDELVVIYLHGPSGQWRAAVFSQTAGLPAWHEAAILTPIANDLERPILGPGYATKIGEAYYLSTRLADGSQATYRWASGPGSPPTRLAGVAEPLVGALGDGTLIARDGSFLKAYDSDGTPLYALRLGSLRLAHERWEATAGTFISVFVRQVFASNNGYDGRLRLEVFERPSKDLQALAVP